jgi:zinc transporter ZupT
MMGRLLALVAGSFVYVAAADLLPEVAHHPRISRTALMVLGLGVAVVVRTWFA